MYNSRPVFCFPNNALPSWSFLCFAFLDPEFNQGSYIASSCHVSKLHCILEGTLQTFLFSFMASKDVLQTVP